MKTITTIAASLLAVITTPHSVAKLSSSRLHYEHRGQHPVSPDGHCARIGELPGVYLFFQSDNSPTNLLVMPMPPGRSCDSIEFDYGPDAKSSFVRVEDAGEWRRDQSSRNILFLSLEYVRGQKLASSCRVNGEGESVLDIVVETEQKKDLIEAKLPSDMRCNDVSRRVRSFVGQLDEVSGAMAGYLWTTRDEEEV